jgi:hypothetical protein
LVPAGVDAGKLGRLNMSSMIVAIVDADSNA